MFNKKIELLQLVALITCLTAFYISNVNAQSDAEKIFVNIGGGYTDTYQGFIDKVIVNNSDNIIRIMILPIGKATDPSYIDSEDREEIIINSEGRRAQLEEVCLSSVPQGISCVVTLNPIFIRTDAENPNNISAFETEMDSIYILGGDPSIAMQVISETPLEKSIETAYNNGVIIAGTTAGAALQSSTMIVDYNQNFSANNSLDFGAVDIFKPPERHGLSFGIESAIFEEQIFQRNRIGRLLNAISLPDTPNLGIGVDASTGVVITNQEIVEDVFGLSSILVLDAQTYYASDNAMYRGSGNALNITNVLFHLLSHGDFTFNLSDRINSLGAPIPYLDRSLDGFSIPDEAGVLFLAGDLRKSLEGNIVLNRFLNLAGGKDSRILIIAIGFPSQISALEAIDKYKTAVDINMEALILSQENDDIQELPEGLTGIMLIGEDQSLIRTESLYKLKEAWLSGVPLLADNAATAIMGNYYSAHPPTTSDVRGAETSQQEQLLLGNTKILPGLSFIDLNIEPQIMKNSRWGRLIALAFQQPDRLTVGINNDTALQISQNGAAVLGDSVAIILDLRYAILDLALNQRYVIANGVLDVVSAGQIPTHIIADAQTVPIRAATPEIITASSTPTPTSTATHTSKPKISSNHKKTATPTLTATRTLRPTETPLIIPPPASQSRANMMILFGVLSVVIVIVGVWFNRNKL